MKNHVADKMHRSLALYISRRSLIGRAGLKGQAAIEGETKKLKSGKGA